jgi:hypothetical protein
MSSRFVPGTDEQIISLNKGAVSPNTKKAIVIPNPDLLR